VKFKEQRKI